MFVGALDSEVLAWANTRVPANLGSVSASSVAIVDTWMKQIKAAGLRSLILRWQFFVGNPFGSSSSSTNLGAVQVPVIIDKGGTIDTSSTVQANWRYSETGAGGGLKQSPSDSSGFLFTNFLCANHYSSDTNAGMCAYITAPVNEAGWTMGVQDVSGNNAGLVGPDYTAVGTRADIWKPGSAIADAGGKGFYHVTKGPSGDVLLYKNGVLFKTTANPGGNRVNAAYQLAIFGINVGGSGVTATIKKPLGCYGCLANMTATQALALYNITQAAQVSLSRNV